MIRSPSRKQDAASRGRDWATLPPIGRLDFAAPGSGTYLSRSQSPRGLTISSGAFLAALRMSLSSRLRRVATAAGVLLALHWLLGLGTLATFGIILAFFRIVSLASIVAALFAVFWAWFLFQMAPVTPVVGAIALLVLWRHRDNILRLARGAEPRIGEKKT